MNTKENLLDMKKADAASHAIGAVAADTFFRNKEFVGKIEINIDLKTRNEFKVSITEHKTVKFN